MNRLQRALLLLAALTVVALLFASQLYVAYRAEGIPVGFAGIFVLQIGHWYCWAIVGPFAWARAAKWPLLPGQRAKNIAKHLATAVPVAAALVLVFSAEWQLLMRLPLTQGWIVVPDQSIATTVRFLFVAYFHVELIVYAGVVAIAHAEHSRRELVRRERESLQLSSQLATARLQVLTAQLQPHFLFNTLHTVGSLILQRKNDAALRILAELGDLLRITLARQNVGLIPLREELEHLEKYLKIEEARFGDRLCVRWDVDPIALDWRVPPLIVQPLVENALKHGVGVLTDAATLKVRAKADGDALYVSVYNDGPLLPEDWAGESSFGFGLRNVQERLIALGQGTLHVANEGSRGVLATFEITHA